jgi:lysozyme
MNIAAVIPNQNSRRKRKPKNTERTDDPEFWNRLREQVGRHEGFEPQAYRDSEKVLTIGYGTNLETLSAPRKLSEVGANYSMIASGREELTREQAYSLMKSDLIDAVKTAKRIFPQYDSFPEEVKLTIPDMIYNLGESRFRGFEKAIKAFKARDFETAAGEMQDSKWYDQVGNRSEYLVDLVREAA